MSAVSVTGTFTALLAVTALELMSCSEPGLRSSTTEVPSPRRLPASAFTPPGTFEMASAATRCTSVSVMVRLMASVASTVALSSATFLSPVTSERKKSSTITLVAGLPSIVSSADTTSTPVP